MISIKKEFPLLKKKPNLVYLDNAATTQKPQIMIDAIVEYYSNFNSNIGRGTYDLAYQSQVCYEQSKSIVAEFINTKPHNIIYTSGCTESLNLAAYIAKQNICKKYIILPITEHHANILVWQRLAHENSLDIYWVNDSELIMNPYNIPQDILDNTAIMSIAHVSNVTGEEYPISKWCELTKKIGAISVIDGAQSITSLKIDISKINCDFFSFSAHKLYGPMGLGVLFINDKFLHHQPMKLGGGIIEDVETTHHTFIDESSRFEAGTPNIANAYAFSKVITWLEENHWDKLLEQTHILGEYLENELKKLNLNPLEINSKFTKTHISSFVIPGVHSHDVGTFLSQKNIAVRVGKHCAYPFHKYLNVNSSIRVSIGIYNTKDDIDEFILAIKDCIIYFN